VVTVAVPPPPTVSVSVSVCLPTVPSVPVCVEPLLDPSDPLAVDVVVAVWV
jgi:hypothetical protein